MSRIKIGDVTSPFVNLLLKAAERYGGDRQALLQRFNLSAEQLDQADSRIGLTEYMKLAHAAIEVTGEPALGLRMGELCRITDLGLPGMVALAAPSLGEALDALARLEPLVSRNYRGSSWLELKQDQSSLVLYSLAPYNDYNRFAVDSILCCWQNLVQRLTGQDDLIQEVHIEFAAPSYQNRYQDAFQAPVRFAQTSNRLVLKPGAHQLSNLYGEPQLYRELRQVAEDKLRRLHATATVSGRVQQILGPMLHGNTPTIEETAAQLGIPDWTLRRKLKEEGSSFQALLDGMRRDLALGYMQDTTLSFGEVAYILGFSTPGAFQRAFKRWTSVTPGEYRKGLRPRG